MAEPRLPEDKLMLQISPYDLSNRGSLPAVNQSNAENGSAFVVRSTITFYESATISEEIV